MSFVINVITLVIIPAFPSEYSVTIFSIHLVVTFILIWWQRISIIANFLMLFPFTFAVLEPSIKHSCVDVAICPFVLAYSIWFSVTVLTYKDISVFEEVWTVAVPKASPPLSLILVSVFPDVHAVPICFVGFPLANIWVTLCSAPDSVAFFMAICPFTVVNFSIFPSKNSFAMGFVVHILALVLMATCKLFVASSVPFIICPLSFINSAVVVDADTKSISLSVLYFSSVKVVFVLLDSEQRRLFNFFIIKFIAHHLVRIKIGLRKLIFRRSQVSCFGWQWQDGRGLLFFCWSFD